MRQEEAELKLRKFHSKMFAKHLASNAFTAKDTEFDVFNIFERLSKETKSSTPVRLSDALLMHLRMNIQHKNANGIKTT